jgi:DNA-binding response OmpR family regulator
MPYKILVVEDETDVLKFAKLRLEKAGYEVITAPDGPSALNQIKQHRVDLVLLDVKLPKMSGYEICKRIREIPDFSGVPVIYVTADASISIAADSEKEKSENYILKPYDAEELLKKIKKYLK